MRGCFPLFLSAFPEAPVLPAYAGMFRALIVSARKSEEFSPRMRGCFFTSSGYLAQWKVLPAYAGMFPSLSCKTHPPISSPRVCGDVSLISTLPNPLVEFSPRMRGCFSNRSTWMRLDAVLPAYAGMFLELRGFFSLDFCSPRVCGDVSGGILGAPEDGCSPRVCAGMFPSTELMP